MKRKYHPGNYKGKWTPEEEKKLFELYETEGRKWEYIGEELGRTAENCRDKFKSMGEANYLKRIKGEWTFKEIILLI